ncbi:hypothetical protein [Mucilaginibacter flavidus]|uniref:hypothetical protein n=1 Tax=Mucilaginibacter flavidus TaxID=2949309 RepID=UPI0020923915|nr:hypothetical protein [Mucilaginibacter flavidus]MCO5949473.1 hypothetical protein [Mucilaginibacter flavidus]
MKRYPPKTINVYLTLDQLVMQGYFNPHDPAPIYKRQLSHHFALYIMENVALFKRYDVIFYKFKYANEIDKQYAEPMMYAIRRHFTELKEDKIKNFKKYKRRNIMMLVAGTLIVTLFHILIPMVFTAGKGISSALSNSLDVFSWVILWHPIDELVFNWNPHLAKINLFNKLATAELIIIENEKKAAVDNSALRVVA